MPPCKTTFCLDSAGDVTVTVVGRQGNQVVMSR